ncbi:MAG: SDR family NAD(P)-dependent oxidoreductase [Xanthomonadales bacterium]|jgi:NAD(P)-dependent dehydrogenase (short-subunit alcohol dehydrogenase family)|nr:SDR family NAD(P)-dependent oxidoreductase [Xanthomonadales bacterium]
MELEGRTALVFGAGSIGPGWGNGKACAVAYARTGARVAVVDLNLERAEETAGLIRDEGGEVIALAADVARSADVESAVQETGQHFGAIDILHNNVGINRPGDPVTMSEANWDLSIDCNLKSVFLACKYVLPVMLRQGRGAIVNISSILSTRVSRYDQVAYYASKAGVDHLTRAVAVRYADRGIRCNAIQPGLINTPLLYANQQVVIDAHGSVEAMVADRDAASPTGKMGEAWDIANAAVFLASDRASYINGVILPVDGGLTCKQA